MHRNHLFPVSGHRIKEFLDTKYFFYQLRENSLNQVESNSCGAAVVGKRWLLYFFSSCPCRRLGCNRMQEK